MCLICEDTASGRKPQRLRARKDIVVWKVLMERTNLAGFYGPYFSNTQKYFVGERRKREKEFTVEREADNSCWVVGPAMHSFESKEKAVAESFCWKSFGRPVVVKCVIPKGARYIRGRCGEIASDELIPVEVVYELRDIKRLSDLVNRFGWQAAKEHM